MKYIIINCREFDQPKLLADRDGVFIFDKDELKTFLEDLESVALADCSVYQIDPKIYVPSVEIEEI